MSRPKKYNTEEERKEARREYLRQWREAHPEYFKQWEQEHKEERDEYRKQWEQEHKEERDEYFKQYRQENKEKEQERYKKYYQDNTEKELERNRQYRQTPMGRALNLLNAYRQNDKKHGRGKCTLTAKWIVENIFPKPCHWCGETGWEIMGCDRIDNSLPHTPDNVNPCCDACNKKRGKMTYEEFEKALRAKETVL